MLHAASYSFLTDDAFISFRYARNLAHGHGLVFNPGFERVEGYTNFLWVLILAALDRVGWAPESAARVLSLAATVALWGLVAWWALRGPIGRGSPWLALVPLVWLATNRSVAVWSTSGLETRGFELLAIAGMMRLAVEVESDDARRGRWGATSAWLLGLACWMRPDGLLVAAVAYAAAALWTMRRGRFDLARFLGAVAPLVLMLVALFAFRRVYYGEWLPNTYYAKFGGQWMWGQGGRYLALFALEYGVWLWVPLLVAGILVRWREGRGFVPFLFGGVVLAHALYVASIGGDHFEYRPLDLYFPLLFLLMFDGMCAWARSARATAGAIGYAGLVALFAWWLPYQSHRQFPDRYVAGFPGMSVDAGGYLDPARDPLMRLPGLRALADAHRTLLRDRTKHFVAVRQEEHRMFLAGAIAQGRELRRLIGERTLPSDVSIAMDCVGAIPYESNVRTLDRLGLTDRHVARSEFRGTGLMAHDKHATIEYAAARGIDLWAYGPVDLVVTITSPWLLAAVESRMTRGTPAYAADLGSDRFVLCDFPAGFERGSRGFPALRFRDVGDPSFVDEYLLRAKVAERESLAVRPHDLSERRRLAYLELVSGELPSSLEHYREIVARNPDDAESWEYAAVCWERLGDRASAVTALERGLAAARRTGDTTKIERLERRLGGGRPSAAPPAAQR
jgi:arabinofuranosyltransferase